jgi:hypothetical protein
MAGATRKSLPRCNQIVANYNKHQNACGERLCGKAAVTIWWYRAVSDDPHYMCAEHEDRATKEEIQDEIEREEEEANERI